MSIIYLVERILDFIREKKFKSFPPISNIKNVCGKKCMWVEKNEEKRLYLNLDLGDKITIFYYKRG